MNIEPHAWILGGKVKFYNFTHYDTGDMVRVIDSLLASKDFVISNEDATDLHIRYGSRPRQHDIVRRSGSRWIYDGLRISRPSALIESPLESLTWDGKLAPFTVTAALFDRVSHLVTSRTGWKRPELPSDLEGFQIRIHPKANAKMPKGYISPFYAENTARRFARAADYRVVKASRHVRKSEAHLRRLEKIANGMDIDFPEIAYLRESMRKTEAELEGLYMATNALYYRITRSLQ